jgi:dethiobiotin synthetase
MGRQLRGLFVTGTGTGLGKTVVAAVAARALAGGGSRVGVFKPVVTGLDDAGEPDHELLRRAAGSEQGPDEVAPYRFGLPSSPHLAAQVDGVVIEPSVLVERARAAGEAADVLVCEGVGGFLVPLTPGYLVRDLARDLALPVVIAASPGLGTINHTLLTIESVRAVGMEPAVVVLTPWPADPSPIEPSNLATIRDLGQVRVERLKRVDLENPESWPSLGDAPWIEASLRSPG